MTVHGTLLRRKSAVDAVDAGIIASPARRCIGTCIIIVAYRRGGGGGCGRASERAMTCSLTAREGTDRANVLCAC